MTKVTAIIPSLYEADGEYLKLAVESLRSTVDWDIMVVTNGGRYKPDLSGIKGITVHLHTSQQGQCNAVNIGAQLASPNTDYLFISNSDMVYSPGWNNILRFDYLCFSPNLIEPTNNPGSAAPFIKLDAGFTLEEFERGKVDSMVKHWTDTKLHGGKSYEFDGQFMWDKDTDELGFNLPFFIRKDLWNFLGGYDTVYDPWGSNSDTDLQTRLNLAGVTPMRLRDVLVYHFSNKSGTFDGTHQDFYQNNIEYFKSKFGFDRDELSSDVWYNKDMIPTDPEKIKYKQAKYNG